LAFLVLSSTAGAQQMPTVSTDTVWVDSIATHSGQKAIVDITFFNADSVIGVDIPLKLSDPAIIIDSVSFVGSRVENNLFTVVAIDSTLGTCKMGALYLGSENTPIGPGKGLFAKMYVDIPDEYPQKIVVIDTTLIITHLTFSSINSTSHIPEFRRGYIDNTYIASIPDSTWVENTSVVAGDQFSVTVNAYNSEPLYHINLPLEYLSDNVNFDSMRLAGTRSDNALLANVMYDNSIKKLLITIGFSEGSLMPAGTGPIAVLHFTTLSPGTTATVKIDTTSGYISEYYFQLGEFFNYMKIYPAFTAGTVSVDLGTAVDEETTNQLPMEFRLEQNVPNPFNPTTAIAYTLPERSHVRLEVYNILGQRVRILVDDVQPPGNHDVIFDGVDGNGQPLATGVYLYVIKTDRFTQSKKMLLMK
jgi:hypothetical protein